MPGVCLALLRSGFLRGAGLPQPRIGRPLLSVDVVSYHPHDVAPFELAWSKLASEHGGLPSINKNVDANVTAADVRALYGNEDYERFRELCTDSGPSGRFINGGLKALFALGT